MHTRDAILSEWMATWLSKYPLSEIQADCVTTIMLKILDGKCKMTASDKVVIQHLYAHTRFLPGELFGEDLHHLIEAHLELWKSKSITEESTQAIYEKRLLAETMISRPVMKAFKKMIREQGLYDVLLQVGDESLLEAEEEN